LIRGIKFSKMKKKIILTAITISVIYLVAFSFTGKGTFSVLEKFLYKDQVYKIKKYLFPYKVIAEKDRKIIDVEYDEKKRIFSYLFELELNFIKSLDDIYIKKVKDVKLPNNKNMSKFTIDNGFYSAKFALYPVGYIEIYDDTFFMMSSRGILGFGKSLEDKNFKQIENNLNDFIGLKQFNKRIPFSLRDLFIHKGKIFISFLEEIEEDCHNTSLLYADLNYKSIKFKKLSFDDSNSCINAIVGLKKMSREDYLVVTRKNNNIDNEFNAMQSGGRIINYDDNHILFTVGEYRNRFLAQEKESINGKILKININDSTYEIISMGHRNPQGLYYDRENGFLLETEHGPMGGDEINLIKINEKSEDGPLNYGWPMASSGEHMGGKIKDNNERYKKYPLYKSHSKYGFIEPLKSFTPSIGISEITKIGKNKYVASSMKDQSLYFFELDSSKKIINLERVEVFERVRDLKFKNDKLYLFLEETASIGVIDFTY